MTVAQKLALLLGGSLLALIVTGGAGLYQAWSVENGLTQVDERILPRIILVEETAQLFSEQRATFWQYLASSETAARNAAEKRFQDLQVQLLDKLKRYEAFSDGSEQDKVLLATDRKEITRYQEFFSMALAWVRQDRLGEARMVIENGEAASQKAAAALAAHVTYNKELNAKRTQAAQRSNIVQRTVLIGLIMAVVLAVAGFGVALYRNVVGGVVRARDMLAHVESALDFTVRAPRQGKDEISQLLDALNRLLDRLQTSMAELNRTTDDVSAAAGGLVNNAASVSQATATQSEAASAMAAAIEEMTVSIGQVSDQTDAAGSVAGQAGQLAQEGAKTVGASLNEIGSVAEMVRTAADELSSLQSQSAEIASIVGLIREIAEQTNLLALNAAIEAARAGETGRGFAVVADEVRKLAERTAGATQKISQTMVAMHETANRTTARINESASLVQGSAERAISANTVLQQISNSTREVLGMMDDIAHAIREQREASLNVARQVEVIAQSAETNMANAAEAAEQAHGVASHARQMRATVDLYQIA